MEILNQSIIPFPVRIVTATYKIVIENSPFAVNNIVTNACLPKSCTYHDLIQVMSYRLQIPNLRNGLFLSSGELVKLRLMDSTYAIYEDSSFYVLAVLTILILMLSIAAWLYDHFTNFDGDSNDNSITSNRRSFHRSPESTIMTQSAIQQLTKLNNSEQPNCLTELKMDPFAESMTVNNINTNKHVNLVQVKKIKAQNSASATISLDIIAGKCDYVNHNGKVRQNCKSNSTARKIVLAFSWRKNLNHLMNANQFECNEIAAVCGVQVVGVMWIMLVHTCTVLSYVCDNKVYRNSKYNFGILAAIINTGSFSIDTFFFLSGVQITYTFYKTIKTILNDHSIGTLDQVIHFAAMIIHKVLRLIFPYLVVLLMLQIVMKYFYHNSIVEIPSQDHMTCQENMWRNMLFIDTFFPIKERCMPWSWFFSLDCQFFVAASIILLIANNHPRYATVICTAFFVSSFVTTTIVRYNKHPKISLTYEDQIAEFNSVYDQPWTRIAPFLLGMCLGYILFKTNETIRLNIFVIISGWIASVLLVCGISFRNIFLVKSNLWIEAALSSSTHTVGPMILFWIILSSISQYQGFIGRFLSSKRLIPLSKLTNCILMVHPLITRLIILDSEQIFHLSLAILFTTYIGFLALSFTAGFVLYMFFEAPLTSLLQNVYYKSVK
ncbi:nose resistant to fluoxetine protein 6-like [Bradysia coprophila]|uniref:nose resistant to fluoxetine protein 6-like n=1 Tax=Bradysia coprophila TaxID=38358 RepID=UPI00187D71EA|nr:nose resistant to fluoxetine protein 6-like [Bradysia coprophila]